MSETGDINVIQCNARWAIWQLTRLYQSVDDNYCKKKNKTVSLQLHTACSHIHLGRLISHHYSDFPVFQKCFG